MTLALGCKIEKAARWDKTVKCTSKSARVDRSCRKDKETWFLFNCCKELCFFANEKHEAEIAPQGCRNEFSVNFGQIGEHHQRTS